MDDGLRQWLLFGEKVLWEGRPYAGLMLRPVDIFAIPFSLLWGGIVFFINAQVWMSDRAVSDVIPRLILSLFLIVGIYVTGGRFIVDMLIRKNLRYVVTDRRILILKKLWGSTVKSVDIKRLPSFELKERADGSGTIAFGPAMSIFSGAGFAFWQPSTDAVPQFIRIPDARRVYDLIDRQSAV